MKEDVKKKILPCPLWGKLDVVTYIQPRLLLRRGFGFAALDRRVFWRRGQPQLLIPTHRFHETVALDAKSVPRLRKLGVGLSANQDPM